MRKEQVLLELTSGISSDMIAAAFAALACNTEAVLRALKPFEADGFVAEFVNTEQYGERGIQLRIQCPKLNHHPHEHRTLSEVFEQIDASEAETDAKQAAKDVYQLLAEAEAKAHDTSPEEVQFHEVASKRTIMQVIVFAVSYAQLGKPEVIVEALYDGSGTVQCAHGEIDVPVPAVRHLSELTNTPICINHDICGELTTPSGAACALAVKTSGHKPEAYVMKNIGIGFGARKTGLPPCIKAVLLETEEELL